MYFFKPDSIKAFLIILAAIIVFGGLILAKIYISKNQKEKVVVALTGQVADTALLSKKIKADSLYDVKEVVFKDSAILISVANPDKGGTEAYFDKKYKLNVYDNINMVGIYQYDPKKPLPSASLEDAIMAKGKKLGKFQEEWVAKFIDTTDGSCRPLKKHLQASLKNPTSFKNEETSYQPESIYKMRVVCKYRSTDSLGAKTINSIISIIDTSGNIISVEKIQ
ncbi:MAG TPA: hypothetical protein VNV85_07140 [Puia sp.]|nr:hypothetical protein [Puia sp.]